MVFLYFVYFSVACRQSRPMPSSLEECMPPSFSGRQFQRSASSSAGIAKGTTFSPLFYSVFFQLFIFYLYGQSFWDWKCFSFSDRPPSFCHNVFFCRQGAQVERSDIQSLHSDALKGMCINEFSSGCYRSVFTKLFLWNQFCSTRANRTSQQSAPLYFHNIQIVDWFRPLQFSAILKTLKESL